MDVLRPKALILNASSLTGWANAQERQPGAFEPPAYLILLTISLIPTHGLHLINQAWLAILDLTNRE